MQCACAVLHYRMRREWLYDIFPHFLVNGTIFRNANLLNEKMGVSTFSTVSAWNILHSTTKWGGCDQECLLVKWNTILMQHCASFISAESLYMFRAQAPIITSPNKEMWWLTCNDNTCTSGSRTSFKYSWWWALAPETFRVTLQKKNLHSVASSWCFIWLKNFRLTNVRYIWE